MKNSLKPGAMSLVLLLALLALPVGASTILAQAPAAPQAKAAPPAEKQDAPRALPAEAVSRHTVGQGESRLAYTASAGTLPLSGAKGEVTAHIFYVAYTLEARRRRARSRSCSTAGPVRPRPFCTWPPWGRGA